MLPFLWLEEGKHQVAQWNWELILGEEGYALWACRCELCNCTWSSTVSESHFWKWRECWGAICPHVKMPRVLVLLTQTLEGHGWARAGGLPAAHQVDVDWVFGSLFQGNPAPAGAGIWGVTQQWTQDLWDSGSRYSCLFRCLHVLLHPLTDCGLPARTANTEQPCSLPMQCFWFLGFGFCFVWGNRN